MHPRARRALYRSGNRSRLILAKISSPSGWDPARNIDREALVDATREQWQAQGILTREAQSGAWLRMLADLWPDVAPGAQLAFVLTAKQGQFWYRASASAPRFIPLGKPQSADFSENFLAIWLGPRTQYPELRQQLTGGKK